MASIRPGAATGSLGDVRHGRLRRGAQLSGQVGVALGQPGDDLECNDEKLDGTLIDVEPLKAQHGGVVGRCGLGGASASMLSAYDAVKVTRRRRRRRQPQRPRSPPRPRPRLRFRTL